MDLVVRRYDACANLRAFLVPRFPIERNAIPIIGTALGQDLVHEVAGANRFSVAIEGIVLFVVEHEHVGSRLPRRGCSLEKRGGVGRELRESPGGLVVSGERASRNKKKK